MVAFYHLKQIGPKCTEDRTSRLSLRDLDTRLARYTRPFRRDRDTSMGALDIAESATLDTME